MMVFDVVRDGRIIRQIAELSRKSAQRWCDVYFPGSTAVFSYRL